MSRSRFHLGHLYPAPTEMAAHEHGVLSSCCSSTKATRSAGQKTQSSSAKRTGTKKNQSSSRCWPEDDVASRHATDESSASHHAPSGLYLVRGLVGQGWAPSGISLWRTKRRQRCHHQPQVSNGPLPPGLLILLGTTLWPVCPTLQMDEITHYFLSRGQIAPRTDRARTICRKERWRRG